MKGSRTTVLSRQLLDAIPVPRMYQAEGALAVGTKVSDQNVGGARAAVNPRLTAHMSVTKDTTIDVDGMKMNTLVGGGDSHPDHNDAMSQEITVQTAYRQCRVDYFPYIDDFTARKGEDAEIAKRCSPC